MAMDYQAIQTGWDVYGSDGDKVGSVAQVGPNYILIEKGWLFPKDFYIPFTAITSLADNRVYLNVSKAQVDDLNWDQPPVDIGYAGTGMTNDTAYATQSSSTRTADQTADLGRVQTGQDTETVRRYEEELNVQKTPVQQVGAVEVNKDVVEEQQSIDVPVTREEVTVTTRDVNQPVGNASDAFQEGTIEVPVRAEQVSVNKETVLAEELEVQKQQVQDTERVSGTVRKERVNLETQGDVDVEGSTGTDISGTSETRNARKSRKGKR